MYYYKVTHKKTGQVISVLGKSNFELVRAVLLSMGDVLLKDLHICVISDGSELQTFEDFVKSLSSFDGDLI